MSLSDHDSETRERRLLRVQQERDTARPPQSKRGYFDYTAELHDLAELTRQIDQVNDYALLMTLRTLEGRK